MEKYSKSSQLRNLQLMEKDVLLDVVKVCEANNIKYYLSSGTLLGAVRHKGFIPWDDDIDIEIPVEDYYVFLGIAQKELGDDYFVQTFMTDPNYNFAYTRIRRNNTTMLNPYHSSYKIHHGVWIDIFPLVAVNPGVSLSIKRSILKISNYIQIQNKIDSHKEEFQEKLGSAGMLIMKALSKLPLKIRQRLHAILLSIVFMSNPDKCSHMANVWGNITSVFPKEVYEGSPEKLLFEGELLNAPHDYKRYLEIEYGDYMQLPPMEKRHGHGDDLIIDLEHSYEMYMKA